MYVYVCIHTYAYTPIHTRMSHECGQVFHNQQPLSLTNSNYLTQIVNVLYRQRHRRTRIHM